MNRATIGRPALRFLADALEQFRDRVAAAEIGRRLDLPTSSVSRDRKDKPVAAWSFAEVIELARTDELLARAVREYLDDAHDAPACDPARLADDMGREIQATAELHSTVMRAQADGRVDARERALIRQRLMERQNADAAILRDMDAMDACEARK